MFTFSLKIKIWDTGKNVLGFLNLINKKKAGQERFQSLGNSFYRGADGVIFVFDVSRPQTFEALNPWKQAFIIQAEIETKKDFPMLVLANKVKLIYFNSKYFLTINRLIERIEQ